ncbi:MAG: hypothetical protein FWE40_08765 [Oscillospiraceae bacterium]|nr:hypothetical protein [Oscillospiraceae bacterium]
MKKLLLAALAIALLLAACSPPVQEHEENAIDYDAAQHIATTQPEPEEQPCPMELLLGQQARQLLLQQSTFEALQALYDLEVFMQSSQFLYAKSRTMPEVEFVFQADADGAFRLLSITARGRILLEDYLFTPTNELPFERQWHNTRSALLLHDDEMTFFVPISSSSRTLGNFLINMRRRDAATAGLPGQNSVGTWYTDNYHMSSLVVYDIGGGKIYFQAGFFRWFGFSAVARMRDDQIVFYCPHRGDFRGTLEFQENSILLNYVDPPHDSELPLIANFPVRRPVLSRTAFAGIRAGSRVSEVTAIDPFATQGVYRALGMGDRGFRSWHFLSEAVLVITYERTDDDDFAVIEMTFEEDDGR